MNHVMHFSQQQGLFTASLTKVERFHFATCYGGAEVVYSQKNLFEILFNQTEIRLYLQFSDLFGTSNGHSPFGSISIGKWYIQSYFGLT